MWRSRLASVLPSAAQFGLRPLPMRQAWMSLMTRKITSVCGMVAAAGRIAGGADSQRPAPIPCSKSERRVIMSVLRFPMGAV